ncbi:MAG TPA: UbiA family prenyltransferase [Desulfuromonadaceae bacterium]|nr:UbiA family prenyltransferase [Desulfuromonadaceae bacterium]
MPRWRTLLILGRVSNLPTVWSNCLVGWLLGGGGNFGKLPLLFLGASLLYTGGMFLNDAFDTEFDRQRRPSRPIPSGAITREMVWVWSFGLLAAGSLLLAFISKTTGVLSLVLLACIVLYNATHKAITASPWLMGLCRFWLYVIAGSAGALGINGWPIWCGLALAFYVVGLSYVARRESFRGPIPYWPLILLAFPVALAMLMDVATARKAAIVLSIILGLWMAGCVRTVFFRGDVNVGKIVSGLLAGIVLVDWLAVAPLCPTWMSITLAVLFGATLWCQRFVPAT